MGFHSESSSNDGNTGNESSNGSRIIGWWIAGCTVLVFAQVVSGGVTRLTESGLSMVEWKPVTGWLPPIGEEAWEEEFEKYQQYPEYQILNQEMTLEEFKKIFFWEWSHRVLGRVIGLSFGVPYAYFLARGKLKGKLLKRTTAILFGIGFQGALGWYMVKSGLEEDITVPRVSQYRLASHLGAAFALYVGMFWTALDLLVPKLSPASVSTSMITTAQKLGPRAHMLAGLVFLTAMSGALVAGLDAGLIYNSFPLMGTGLVPPEIFDLTPFWRNFTENDATVQFDHRLLGTTTWSLVALVYLSSIRKPLSPRLRVALHSVMAMATLQVTLGISTLLMLVPTPVAASHQAGSLSLLSVVLWLMYEVKILRLLKK